MASPKGLAAFLPMTRTRGTQLRSSTTKADTYAMQWLILLVPVAAALMLHNPRLNAALLGVFAKALALVGSQEDKGGSEPA